MQVLTRRWATSIPALAKAAGTIAIVLFLASCQGQIGTNDDETTAPGGTTTGGSNVNLGNGLPQDTVSKVCVNAGPQPGASPIRRLTRTEYNNTVHDLLGDTTAPATKFTHEEVGLGFTNNADVANGIGSARRAIRIGCRRAGHRRDPESAEAALLRSHRGRQPRTPAFATFLLSFGQKAYRRPLESTEVDRFFAFYATSKTDLRLRDRGSSHRAGHAAVAALSLSRGDGHGVAGSETKLSGFETASRLSYLLWGTMPDAALFAAASSGELDTPAGVAAQAQRMLKDPRTRQSVGTFFSQWLDLDKLDKVEKDATVFPKLHDGHPRASAQRDRALRRPTWSSAAAA